MNDVMPGWRTFGSGGQPGDEPPDDPRGSHDRPRSTRARAITLTLAIAGAVGLVVGLVLLVLLLLPFQGSDDATVALGGAGGLTDILDGDPPGADVGVVDGERQLVVDVAGAVMRPGLVRLSRGGRVADAIAAAGGFSPHVDLAETGRTMNLAESVIDGAKIVVVELGSGAALPAAQGDGLVDLNTADQAALEDLPGIGPVTATRIIEAREQQRFASVEELRTRDVVGEAVFEDIQGLVRASG